MSCLLALPLNIFLDAKQIWMPDKNNTRVQSPKICGQSREESFINITQSQFWQKKWVKMILRSLWKNNHYLKSYCLKFCFTKYQVCIKSLFFLSFLKCINHWSIVLIDLRWDSKKEKLWAVFMVNIDLVYFLHLNILTVLV